MRTTSLLLATALAVAVLSATASATAGPPSGHYKLSLGGAYGFTVSKSRTSVTGLRFAVNVGDETTSECSPIPGLPAGKRIVRITSPLRIVAAHRGGYTAYIVGRSTPQTSNGITAIPETFHVASGGTVKGTLSIVFTYDRPSTGDAQIMLGSCLLPKSFKKG